MKKRILISILFIICFITTGCTAKYEVTINDDYSVDESITSTDSFANMGSLLKYETFDEYVTGLYENSGYEEIGGKLNQMSENSGLKANVTTHYNSVSDFIEKSPALKEMFDNVSIEDKDNKFFIKSEGYIPLYEETSTRQAIENIEIRVISHYSINGLENATCNIEKGYNVCTVKLNQTNESYKLDFNINKKSNSMQSIVFFIIGGIIVLILFGLFTYGSYTKSREI